MFSATIYQESANNSLFVNKEENNIGSNSLFGIDTRVDNMDNNSLFNDNSVNEVKNDSFNSDLGTGSSSLFVDPTTVDINKIREASSDINVIGAEKESADIKSLLNPDGFKIEDTSRFVNIFEEDKPVINEEKANNNDVVGNGLLAGMPVIKPVNAEVDENKSSTFTSLFDTLKVDHIIEEPSGSLFGNNQNAVNSDTILSSNNVQVAVSDVKNVIKSYQDKGYNVTVEELDLDREIQLIVKFNKN